MNKLVVILEASVWAAMAASNQQTDSLRQPAVTLSLVALDAKNQPVRDLRASELRISDNGKTLSPEYVRFLETGANPAVPRRPNEYTNRPANANSHSTLVLLDLLNANLGERGLGSSNIALALQKVEAGENLYLYLLTKEGKFYPVHGLPETGAAGAEDASWTAGVKPLLDKAMHAVSQLRPQDFQVDADLRTRQTFATLGDLVPELGALLGRKALVWVSHGVPLTAYSAPTQRQTDYTPRVRDLASKMYRAGISVYPVDQSDRTTMSMESKDTLWQLAGLTGGVWFPSDVPGQAILQAVTDAHAMYLLGYAPPMTNWDGKYHTLRVTCERKGVRIRAIAGYYADPADLSPQGRLTAAALGESDAADIGVRVTVTPNNKVAGWLHFEIHVDAHDLTFEPGERYTGEVRLTYVDYVTDWGPAVDQGTPVKLDLTAEQRAGLLRDGMTVAVDRPVKHAARKMRVVVQDSLSGAAGSVTIPISAARLPQ